jgi:tryptophan-rich sensory protein
LAIAAMAIWPLIQILRYNMPAAQVFYEEVVVWTGPTQLGIRPYFAILFGLSTLGGACGLVSLLAAFAVLFSKQKRPSAGVREIAIVSLAVITLAVVTNFRGVRYIIPIVPCLCFLLALSFHRFLEQRKVIRLRTAIVLTVVLLAGFVHSTITIDRRRKDAADQKLIAEKLGTLQLAGAKTLLIRSEKPGEDLMWDSFYLFHGNFRYPVVKLTPDEIRADPPKPPLIGVAVARDFLIVQELYPNVQVELTRAQFICWRVPGQ